MRRFDARLRQLEAAGSAVDVTRGPSAESCIEVVTHLHAKFQRLLAYFRTIGAPASHMRRLEQLRQEWIPSRLVRATLTAAQAEAQVLDAMAEARAEVARSATLEPCARRGNAINLAYESAMLARRFAPELEAVAEAGWSPCAATPRELVASVCGPEFLELGLPYPRGESLLDILRPIPELPAYWEEWRAFSASLAELDPHE